MTTVSTFSDNKNVQKKDGKKCKKLSGVETKKHGNFHKLLGKLYLKI